MTKAKAPSSGRLQAVALLSAVVAAMGGLLFGFDTAVISGVTHSLTVVYRLSPVSLGLTVSSALVGTILGAMPPSTLYPQSAAHLPGTGPP